MSYDENATREQMIDEILENINNAKIYKPRGFTREGLEELPDRNLRSIYEASFHIF